MKVNSKPNHETSSDVIVRFPPSPTGHLHIGNVRTFLFNYLFARRHNGKIIMRFEDTDQQRSSKEYEEEILSTLEELKLDFDEGPFWQSKRNEIYKAKLQELIDTGKAYLAEENQDKTGQVIRFKNPNKRITFKDTIRGDIEIDTTQYGDFVIARSIDNPLYHLTVVVDDIEFGITHIIRGEDHITSTPRQILLFEAFQAKIPEYAHLPLIVGKDKKKLSKRHGAITFAEFKKQGVLPFAFLNYLALLGWSPGNDKELFDSMQELIKSFELKKVNPSPAMFDYEKLYAINKYHISRMPEEDFESTMLEFASDKLKKTYAELSPTQRHALLNLAKERISKFEDITTVEQEDLHWLYKLPDYEPQNLIWKKSDCQNTKLHLGEVMKIINNLPDSEYQIQNLENTIKSYASEHGMGDVLWPLRFALTGSKKSPDPFTVLFLLSKQESIHRLNTALQKLSC